jgi:hypothetical protein
MSVDWYKLTPENALQQIGSAADGLSGDKLPAGWHNGPNELVAKAQLEVANRWSSSKASDRPVGHRGHHLRCLGD